MIDRSAVLEGVRGCLVEVLDVAPEAISPEARIIGDLGADSLDLLDLVFQLEQHFGITISPRTIERRTQAKLGEVPMEVDGVYTPEMLAELRRALPEVPPEEMADGLRPSDLPRRFRVATMVNLVSTLLEEHDQESTRS